MSSDKINMLIDSEKEMRTFIFNQITEIKEDIKDIKNMQYQQSLFINTLKIKVAFFSVTFGIIGSLLLKYIKI